MGIMETILELWGEHHTIRKALKCLFYGGIVSALGYYTGTIDTAESAYAMSIFAFLQLLENWAKHNLESVPETGKKSKR